MKRIESLKDIARQIEAITRQYGRRSDISITFDRLTQENIGQFTDYQRELKRLTVGEEYFFVWEPRGLLYAVCVTADSYLTAAQELFDLLARKF